MMYVTQAAMECCGLITGQMFYGDQKEFDKLRLAAAQEGRTCALITLASHQSTTIELARKNGFVVVYEFLNKSSGYQCYVMARTYDHDD